MTRVVVVGIGRLGQAIVDAAADDPDIEVVAGVDLRAKSTDVPIYRVLEEVREPFDVIVDASRADNLSPVLDFALDKKVPLVIAATGHDDDHLQELARASKRIPVLRSSNLSVGVGVVRRLVAKAGRLLGDVDAEIIETHHRMKTDAPSGTALTLAETLREVTEPDRPFIYGRSPDLDTPRGGEIGIHAVRGGTVVGDHTVRFLLDDEIVEVKHVALSRQVFANGALRAVNFITKRGPGLYGMDVLLDAED